MKHLPHSLLLSLVCFTSSCHTLTETEERAASLQLRNRSQQALHTTQLETKSVRGMAVVHTATLFDEGCENVRVNNAKSADGKGYHFDLTCHFGKLGGSISSAVPISDDGYFLTAGHCTEAKSLRLVGMNKSTHRMELHPARVVFALIPAKEREEDPDLAILHVDMPTNPWSLAEPRLIHIKDTVTAVGRGSMNLEETLDFALVGKITNISALRTHAATGLRYYLLKHTTPLYYGDSGGPLLTQELKLAGINAASGIPYVFWLGRPMGPQFKMDSVSFLPDATWLESMLKKDRAEQR